MSRAPIGARWWIGVAAMLGAGVLLAYAPSWSGDPRERILVWQTDASPQSQELWRASNELDGKFAVWLVSRNARTFVTRPHRIMDTEHCAPARNTIALGPPMLTLGALAVPAWLATRDPVLTWNVVVLLVPVLGGLAMFLLVADWTRLPAAGAVAAALYALAPVLLVDVTHPFIRDIAWILLGLFFARRWLAHGRWRDAVGLAASCALQLGASSYAIITGIFLTPPLIVWILLRHRFGRARLAQLGLVLAVAVLAAAWVTKPYLELRAGSDLLRRPFHFYLAWSELLPGGSASSGVIALLLAGVGLVLRPARRDGSRLGDPRLALCVAGALVCLAATGGNGAAQLEALAAGRPPPPALPNLYALAAGVLPLLDAVRGVKRLAVGVHAVICILAGFGAAALLRRVPVRHAATAAIAAVAAAALATLLPPLVGLASPMRIASVAVRPDAGTLEFYDRLGRLGNDGPMLELPLAGISAWGIDEEVSRILASAWHGRRTSACFGSYRPPELGRLRRIAQRLPDREAALALRELGFTTVVLHGKDELRRRFRAASAQPDSPLRRVHVAGALAAWAIDPPAQPLPAGDAPEPP